MLGNDQRLDGALFIPGSGVIIVIQHNSFHYLYLQHSIVTSSLNIELNYNSTKESNKWLMNLNLHINKRKKSLKSTIL